MTHSFKRFDAGTHMPNAGLTVLKLLSAGELQRKTSYSVRMDCCGSQPTLSHLQIVKRGYTGSRTCNACRNWATVGRPHATLANAVMDWQVSPLMLKSHREGWDGR